jgi:aspartyl-tRNA(Asn)/glutamyl-tRNA(Gln) amidotransferase subunit C
MKLTPDQVRHVAELANLALSDAEIARMARDLDEILTHIDKLNELDTSNVEPMAQVLFESDRPGAPGDDTLRDDAERPCLDQRTALANAPLAAAGYFKVPKVIERG